MKLAWIAVAGPSDRREAALQRLETIADTFLSVNTPVQVGAAQLLEAGASVREQILARVRANREALLGLQRSASCWSCLDAQAGWYAVLRLPRLHSDDEWCLRFLERAHVYAHPGHYYSFPVDGHVVLSLLPRPDEFLAGMTRIVNLVEEEATKGG
jgi:aspartate/methionine/tyrosine aminotransferase